MKRMAAHYIEIPPGTRLKLHYVELSDDNRLVGVFPLEHEIAQTAFYNGTLVVREDAETGYVTIEHIE